ncbi:MAG: alkaline phosphatase PhoX [Egibacteraceae bacterium]
MTYTERNLHTIHRRRFLGGAAALLGTAGPLQGLVARAAIAQEPGQPDTGGYGDGGYGPLRPAGPELALPEGFTYVMFGVEGSPMSNGSLTPRAHDGMCALPLANGGIRLIRNHEDRFPPETATLIGDAATAYDQRAGGGTTSLEIEVTSSGERRLVRSFVSLNGTIVNCAGGPTPWGSWLSCEETTEGRAQGWEQEHGYVFEVPATAQNAVVAQPLRAMGRFVHEAAAVDPRTRIVYETEDNGTAGFYRFIPDRPGDLRAGGSLQMLAVRDQSGYDTRTGQRMGQALPVVWVDIDDPDPEDAAVNDLAVYQQGFAEGGATFARLEGCWWGDDAVYFNSTSGGDVEEGQVWEYRPTGADQGILRLIFESPDEAVLDNPDNITVTPRGGIVLCEDGDRAHLFMRGLTRDGQIFDFAQNLVNNREWAGATFSPDGQTLFVNIQGDTSPDGDGDLGMTFAIWGPWEKGAL